MKRILLLLVVVFTLFSCKKEDDGLEQNLQLNMKSCVLDNEHSYVDVKKLKGTGSLDITSSNLDIGEVRFDEENKNVFYIIGHAQGKATITVVDIDYNKTGEYDVKTIDVDVREPIYYENYSSEDIFVKKGEIVYSNYLFILIKMIV